MNERRIIIEYLKELILLQISDMAMQYTSLGLLLVIFNRAKAVLGYLNPLMNGEKYEGFKKSFIDDLIKV